MTLTYESFEQKIQKLSHYSKDYDTLTINEIAFILGHSANYILILFFVIPFMQPIPLVGFSTACGIVFCFTGLRIICDKRLWLPRYLRRKHLRQATVQKICSRLLSLFERTRLWIRPRGRFMSRHGLVRRLDGFIIALLGILLALPLPLPFTNTLPALTLLLLCLGTLKEDGLVIMASWALTAITLAYFFIVTIAPFIPFMHGE